MTNPVADELQIRQLVASYADAVNRVDGDQWAKTWAENGAWVLPGLGAVAGKENVVNLWQQAMKGFEFVAQLVYQGTVAIDGDTATGRWYLSEHLRPAGSSDGMFNIGTYADEYQKVDGDWLFTKRDYHILYNDEGKGNMSGIVTPLPQ
jgi:ketosteroid isomerase-like protein